MSEDCRVDEHLMIRGQIQLEAKVPMGGALLDLFQHLRGEGEKRDRLRTGRKPLVHPVRGNPSFQFMVGTDDNVRFLLDREDAIQVSLQRFEQRSRPGGRGFRRQLLLQKIDISPDHGQGRLELVGEMIEGFAFHLVQALEFLSRLLQRVDPGFLELGDFDKDGRVVGKKTEKRLIFLGEDPIFLIQELDDSQSLPIPVMDRRAKKAPGAIPGTLIDFIIEPGVGIGIRQVDRFPGLETVTGNSGTARDSNHLPRHAEGHLGPEFPGFRIVEEESAAVRPHHFAGFLGNLHKHLVQLEIQSDQLPKFQQGVKLADPIVSGLLLHHASADPCAPVATPSSFSACPANAETPEVL